MNTGLLRGLGLTLAALTLGACGSDAVVSPTPDAPSANEVPNSTRVNLQKRGPAGSTATFQISATGGTLLQGSTITIPACPDDGTVVCTGVPIWAPTDESLVTVTVTEISTEGNIFLDWINIISDLDGVTNILDPVEPTATIRADWTHGGLIRFKNAELPPPSLRVVKTAVDGTVQAGEDLAFVIDVFSDGPGTATGVTLIDALPAGTGINWHTVSAGCTITGAAPTQTLSCDFGDMPAGTQASALVMSTTPADGACGEYVNTVSVSSTNHGTVTSTATATVDGCRPPEGVAGCTPGFWKQRQHFQYWTAPYTPSTAFGSVFANAFPGQTLLDVVSNGGGGLEALGRHTVAALLNAADTDVDYGPTPAQVIAAFNAAYTSGDYETQKNIFEGMNERGCTAKD